MLVVGAQARAVDGILRAGVRLRDAIAGRNHVRDCIGKRLDGKTPDGAFEDGVVRGRVDFIDAPIVGLREFQQAGRIVNRGALALTDQHTHRIGSAGIIDVVKRRAEVDIMCGGIFAGRPGQNHVIGHVSCFVIGNRIRGQFRRRQTLHRGHDLCVIERMIVDADFVEADRCKLGHAQGGAKDEIGRVVRRRRCRGFVVELAVKIDLLRRVVINHRHVGPFTGHDRASDLIGRLVSENPRIAPVDPDAVPVAGLPSLGHHAGPVPRQSGEVDPCRQRVSVCGAESQVLRVGDPYKVVDAIELQACPLSIPAGTGPRGTLDCAGVAIAGLVDHLGAASLVQGPVPDQIRNPRPRNAQQDQIDEDNQFPSHGEPPQ